jgi:hypothetical protein
VSACSVSSSNELHGEQSSPLGHILSQLKQGGILSSNISSLYIYLCLGLPRGLFQSVIPTKTMYSILFSEMHATYSSYLICLEGIVLT